MRGNRFDRAFALRRERLHAKIPVPQPADHAVAAAAGRGGDCRAFQNFAKVGGQPPVIALFDGQGREHRRIIGAPRHDHVRSGFESPDKGLNAHLPDYICAFLDILLGQLGRGIQRDYFARGQLRQHGFT
jgi:hypothetical protein